jgi:RNA polymerase-binding transcription factor DksA
MAKKSTSNSGTDGLTTVNGQDDTQKQDITIRYSTADLLEFKQIITKKLEEHKEELAEEMKIELTTDLPYPDRIATVNKRSSLQTKIIPLESALSRIEDKSYGICSITKQLIPKARLRLEPTATFTVGVPHQAYKQKNQQPSAVG